MSWICSFKSIFYEELQSRKLLLERLECDVLAIVREKSNFKKGILKHSVALALKPNLYLLIDMSSFGRKTKQHLMEQVATLQ